MKKEQEIAPHLELSPESQLDLTTLMQNPDARYDRLRNLLNGYKQHDRGFFILGPSGVGKTTFVEGQTPDVNGQLDWMDADGIWYASGALPDQSTEWWRKLAPNGPYDINELDRRCDTITKQAKTMGLWLLGASDNDVKPDAIVIPEWDQHVSQIKDRESDPEKYAHLGGAKSDKLDQVQSHIEQIVSWEAHGAPRFTSIQEATEYCAKMAGEDA